MELNRVNSKDIFYRLEVLNSLIKSNNIGIIQRSETVKDIKFGIALEKKSKEEELYLNKLMLRDNTTNEDLNINNLPFVYGAFGNIPLFVINKRKKTKGLTNETMVKLINELIELLVYNCNIIINTKRIIEEDKDFLINDLNARISELKVDYNTAIETYQSNLDHLNIVKQALSVSREEVTELREELLLIKEKNESDVKIIAALQHEITLNNSEIKTLQNSIESSREVNNELRKELTLVIEKYENNSQTITALQCEIDSNNSEINILKDNVESSREVNNELRKDCIDFQNRIEYYKPIENLKLNPKTIEFEFHSAKKENAILRNAITKEQDINNSLTLNIDDLTNALNEFKKDINTKDELIKNLRFDISMIKENLQQLSDISVLKNTEVSELNKKIYELITDLKQAKLAFETVTFEKLELEGDNIDYRNNNVKLNELNNELANKIKVKNKLIESLKQDFDNLNIKFEALKNKGNIINWIRNKINK